MEIKDLKARMGNVDVEGEIVEKGDVREFNKNGNSGRVCNAKLKDDSGTIKLTMWNDEIDQIEVGKRIKVTNGYISEFQGEKQLSAGKFGKLEVLD